MPRTRKSYASNGYTKNEYFCTSCDFKSYSETAFKLHFKVKHGVIMKKSEIPDNGMLFLCSICKKLKRNCFC